LPWKKILRNAGKVRSNIVKDKFPGICQHSILSRDVFCLTIFFVKLTILENHVFFIWMRIKISLRAHITFSWMISVHKLMMMPYNFALLYCAHFCIQIVFHVKLREKSENDYLGVFFCSYRYLYSKSERFCLGVLFCKTYSAECFNLLQFPLFLFEIFVDSHPLFYYSIIDQYQHQNSCLIMMKPREFWISVWLWD